MENNTNNEVEKVVINGIEYDLSFVEENSERFKRCENCDDWIDLQDESSYIKTTDGELFCRSCVDNYDIAFQCSNCDKWYNSNKYSYNYVDGDIVCDDCLNSADVFWYENDMEYHYCDNENFSSCESCGEYEHIDNMTDTHDGSVCESCMENYYYCGSCNEYYHDDDIEYDEENDEYYCENCMRERRATICNEVMNYSYKPELKIFKSKNDTENENLYIGFELETEKGGNYTKQELVSSINKNINSKEETNSFLYFKSDSSLNNGVEIVSHAFTKKWFLENKDVFKTLCETITEKEFKSHDTSTCGLHFHINKKHFGKDGKEINDNINKLILFTEYFKQNIKIFSRRDNYHYCEFLSDARNLEKEQICNINRIDREKGNVDRYAVINTRNSDTVEIRVFRGTAKTTTLLATIEFVFSLVELIKADTKKITWSKLINAKWCEYLKPYCKLRGILNSYDYIKDYSFQTKRELKKLNIELDKLYKKANVFVNEFLESIVPIFVELTKTRLSSYNITTTWSREFAYYNALTYKLLNSEYIYSYNDKIYNAVLTISRDCTHDNTIMEKANSLLNDLRLIKNRIEKLEN